MTVFKSLCERVRGEPHAALAACVFAVAAYVSLVNLDHARLWCDEVPAAFLARNLLEQGDILGWDGRNLVAGPNGVYLNEDLRDVGPPLQYFLTAAGFAVLGINETGARIFHALAGLLALGFFHLVLRQHLPENPRLRLFIFLFAAWSAQLVMYFRHARYYGVAVLCLMAMFYCYERYWQSRQPVYLAAVTLVAALGFFNHYAAGTAAMLSLAAWHVMFRARETTPRQWLAFGVCGAAVGALGLGYLLGIGLIGGGRDPTASFLTADFGEYQGTLPLFLLRIWICARDLFAADWVSWPVFLWFAVMPFFVWRSRRSGSPGRVAPAGGAKQPALKDEGGEDLPWIPVARIVLLGGLFAVTLALLSVQPVWLPGVLLDLRHYVPALPLLLAMKGLFTEWAWRRSKVLGSVAGAVLLFTSLGAAPFNIPSVHTGKGTLDSHPYQFVREIHRPYREVAQVVSDHFLRHAGQDDLVSVHGFRSLGEELTFYLGHRVHFCPVLNEQSILPRDKLESMGLPPHIWSCTPDWIVVAGPLRKPFRERIEPRYDLHAALDVYHVSTQRPELHRHAFEPLPVRAGVHVFRLRKEAGPRAN